MYDVIVIGGGIAGAATAYFLAADGVSTLLIERDDINSQASGSNSGSLHAQIPFEEFQRGDEAWNAAFSPVIRLLKEAVGMWERLPALLNRSDLELSLKGGVIAALTDAEMRLLERKAAMEREQGLDVRMLDRPELRQLAPYLSERMIGGAFCKNEGSANPMRVTPALADAATKLGARMLTHATVEALSATSDGFRVFTNRGTFDARRVVDAAGAAAGDVARMLGLHLPVDGYVIQSCVTERVQPFIPHLVYYASGRLTLKQTKEGTLIIGGGWPARTDALRRPIVDQASLTQNIAVARSVVPQLAGVHVVRSWAAVVNGTDDWKPVFGEFPGAPGFFVVFFPWLGFTAGPLAGRITASLVQGKKPDVETDLSPFLL
jgi:glycine/D-amino acid oxidase-like deaminating enzyme